MRTRVGFVAIPLLLLSVAACGGGSEPDRAAPPAKNAAPPAENAAPPGQAAQLPAGTGVKITQSSLGPILTDQANRTLYAFTKDKGGASSCDADCIATWPALTSTSQVTAGEGAKAALLKGAQRAEGTTQASYGDWPLYYYAGDVAAGDINGQGVDGVWFVITPDGKLVRTKP
jgi:predicted lipoprotein with Yx(FWY)xxD motif